MKFSEYTMDTKCYFILLLIILVLHCYPLLINGAPLYVDSKCFAEDCFNLSRIARNPIRYIISNTTVEFLPGSHTISSEHLIEHRINIANVRNITIRGPANKNSLIYCTENLGFTFINITTLTLSNLRFSNCGTTTFPIAALFMLGIYNLNISGVEISNSTGPGLVVVNALGFVSVSHTIFKRNTPNCQFLYLDNPIFRDDTAKSLTHLLIDTTDFILGNLNLQSKAAGLTVTFKQTFYNVSLRLKNVTAIKNHGGGFWFNLNGCNSYLVKIQAQGINCTDDHGTDHHALTLKINSVCNLLPQAHPWHLMKLSHCCFTRNKGGVILLHLNQPELSQLLLITLENILAYNNRNRNMYTDSVKAIHILNLHVLLVEVSVTHNEGVALYTQKSRVTIKGNSLFRENSGYWGSVVLQKSNVTLQGNVTFYQNYGKRGGAVYILASVLTMQGHIQFIENEGYDGGALSLHDGSSIMIEEILQANFEGNHALHYGGAIFVDAASDYAESVNNFGVPPCFFSLPPKFDDIDTMLSLVWDLPDRNFSMQIQFENNTANEAGSALYGGWVDVCIFTFDASIQFDGFAIFKKLFHYDESEHNQDPSLLSSNPSRVCVCADNTTSNCSIQLLNIKSYPGKTFHILAVAVGQLFGTVPTTVFSEFTSSESNASLDSLQYAQRTGKTCTDLSYTIKSSNRYETMLLAVERFDTPEKYGVQMRTYLSRMKRGQVPIIPNKIWQFSDLYINITLHSCPPGFILSHRACTCDPELLKHGINCNIDTQRILRGSTVWINATFANGKPTGVLVHEHCPFDYCKPCKINLSLDDPDEQCAFHRTGILCGKCQQGLSHVLGSSSCKECSNFWALLVFAFLLIGIVLTGLLIILNLTVAIGTINGLIFYANIVRANHAIFFPPDVSNSFPSWFIAWLNLDLGIETCFYNGLDAYTKTWLQFVFPAYMWLILITIIVSSHYSTTAAKISGRNAVPVLATLFLLSYTKLLRITVTSFQSTLLEYPHQPAQRVWLYDGNIQYLWGKHIPLFAAALILLLGISLPYTVILLFIQCLQLRPKYRLFFWVHRLKPLFDAYTGPYKDRYRYWTGLLLFLRAVLFIVFSVNVLGNPAINLLTISITITCRLLYTSFLGGIYKRWYLNIIEYSFFVNLGILSSGTLYTIQTNGSQMTLINISVAIAVITFTSIIVYHTIIATSQRHKILEWLSSKSLKKMMAKFQQFYNMFIHRWRRNYGKQNSAENQRNLPVQNNFDLPHNFIELREPLLEYCDAS